MTIDWNDPALQVTDNDFINFDAPGVTVSGTVASVVQGTDFNGAPCPQLHIDTDAGSKTVTCGQSNLKKQIVALRPAVGDTIRITFDKVQPTASGFKMKVFVIEHSKGSGAAPVGGGGAASGTPVSEPPFA